MISIYTTKNTIFIRFKNIPTDDFDHLLVSFKHEFDNLTWDWKRQY